MGLHPIQRAADTRRSSVENMDVDHSRFDIAMAQQFLNCSKVIAAFEQVHGKRMAEGAARSELKMRNGAILLFRGWQVYAEELGGMSLFSRLPPPWATHSGPAPRVVSLRVPTSRYEKVERLGKYRKRTGPPRAGRWWIARPNTVIPSAALFNGVFRIGYFRSVPPYLNAQIAVSAVLASRSTNPSIEIVYSLARAR
jgi:hypothetical protein